MYAVICLGPGCGSNRPVLRGIDARLRYAEGVIATHQGQLESAQTTFHSLLEEYERLGEPLRVAECLNALAVVAERQGEVEGGVGFLERCFQIRSEHDSPLRGQVRVLCNIGVFQARMNDHDAALATYRFAEERLDGHHPELLGLILTSRALLYRSLGRMEQVHGLLTEATAAELWTGSAPPQFAARASTEKLAASSRGRAHLSVADSMVETIGMVIFVPEARLVAAQIHLKNGEHAQADAVLEEGLSAATDEQRARLLSCATGAEAAGDQAHCAGPVKPIRSRFSCSRREARLRWLGRGPDSPVCSTTNKAPGSKTNWSVSRPRPVGCSSGWSISEWHSPRRRMTCTIHFRWCCFWVSWRTVSRSLLKHRRGTSWMPPATCSHWCECSRPIVRAPSRPLS